MGADFDEQRFRWVHPERETWNRFRQWAGLGGTVLAGLGGLVLAGADFQVTPPGPEPVRVECPGHAACVAALPDWFADLPEPAVVETAVHNRLVRGLTAHRAELQDAMAGKVVVGRVEQARGVDRLSEAGFEATEATEATVIGSDGLFTTTDTVLDDLAGSAGLEVDSEESWADVMPDIRLPVEDRRMLPTDFPMRADADVWLGERTTRAVEAYSAAVESAYAEATAPTEHASLLQRAAWHQAQRNWAGSMVAFGLLALSGMFAAFFVFATRAHRRREDRHVRLTRHKLEEVSVEAASVVEHPRIVDVLDSLALPDANEAEVAGFIAGLGRDGHVLDDRELQAFAAGLRARREAARLAEPVGPETRRALEKLRQGRRRSQT